MKINKVKAFLGFGALIVVGVGGGLWMSHQRSFQGGSVADGGPAQGQAAESQANIIPGLEGCQTAEFHGQIDKQLLKWNTFIGQLDKTKSTAEQLEEYRKQNGLPVTVHENAVDADVNAPDSLISASNCSPRPMTLFLKHFLNGEVNFRSANSSVLPAADISELSGHKVTKHWSAEPDTLPEFIAGDTLYFKRMLIPECATCVDETCSEHNGPIYYLATASNGTLHVVDVPASAAEKYEGHDVDCPAAKSIAGINHEAVILCREYVDMTSNKKRILIYDPPCDEDHAADNGGAPPEGESPAAAMPGNGEGSTSNAAPAEGAPAPGPGVPQSPSAPADSAPAAK